MSLIEEQPKIVIGKGSIKVWSEKTQKYYYKSLDPDYYNKFFHANKKEMVCDICGKTVTCQLYNHKKSQKCMAVRREQEVKALQEEIERLKANIE